jgi:hypothetical protein
MLLLTERNLVRGRGSGVACWILDGAVPWGWVDAGLKSTLD